jgi:hypothetical protein
LNDGTSISDAVTAAALIRILHELPHGCTELGCHPAAAVDFETMYRAERVAELEALCDVTVRDAVESLKIELCTFAGLSPRPDPRKRVSLTAPFAERGRE